MSAKSAGSWRPWLVGFAAILLLVYMVADASGVFVAPDPTQTAQPAVPVAPPAAAPADG